MQTKKMSLANVQGKLSRNEMKKIMAGSGCPDGGLSQGNDWIHCNDGTVISSTNLCSNSVGVCNNHGGFDYCVCL